MKKNYKSYLLSTVNRRLLHPNYNNWNKWACITFYYKDSIQCSIYPVKE